MNNVLKKVGIEAFDGAVYSYYPQQLPWWDEEYPVSVEIEVDKDVSGNHSIAVLFVISDEETKERDAIFLCEYNNGELLQNTLVTDAVVQELDLEEHLSYLKEEEAYATHSMETSEMVLSRILSLIEAPQFVQRTSFCNLPEDLESTEGETLNHFLAMFSTVYDEYNEENIRAHLETCIAIEGPEYIDDLRQDLASDELNSLITEHGVTREILQQIREEVSAFELQ